MWTELMHALLQLRVLWRLVTVQRMSAGDAARGCSCHGGDASRAAECSVHLCTTRRACLERLPSSLHRCESVHVTCQHAQLMLGACETLVCCVCKCIGCSEATCEGGRERSVRCNECDELGDETCGLLDLRVTLMHESPCAFTCAQPTPHCHGTECRHDVCA